jgi:hypothetical protein
MHRVANQGHLPETVKRIATKSPIGNGTRVDAKRIRAEALLIAARSTSRRAVNPALTFASTYILQYRCVLLAAP